MFHRKYRWHIPADRIRPTWHYLTFAIGGSVSAYLIAAIIDVERMKTRKRKFIERLNFNKSSSVSLSITNNTLMGWWKSIPEKYRTVYSIMACNTIIFCAWKMPTLKGFLGKWFLHSIHSHPITMLTSCFSHYNIMHLGFNMLALWSFAPLLHEKMGREQFLAFYITGGLMSSFGSHLFKLYRRDSIRSLGASGALFAVAGACSHIPGLYVSIIFLPFLSLPLKMALPATMAIDAIGLIKRWSTFDHAAHLSGAAFGYIFSSISHKKIWPNRIELLKKINYPIK